MKALKSPVTWQGGMHMQHIAMLEAVWCKVMELDGVGFMYCPGWLSSLHRKVYTYLNDPKSATQHP